MERKAADPGKEKRKVMRKRRRRKEGKMTGKGSGKIWSQQGRETLKRQKKGSRPLLWQQGSEDRTRKLRKWQKEEKAEFGHLEVN